MEEPNCVVHAAPEIPFVVIAGHFPEPLHGAAFANSRVEKILNEAGLATHRIDVAPGRGTSLALRLADYLARILRGFGDLFAHGAYPARVLYVSLSGGLRQAVEAAIMLYARAFGWKIVVHHHNFTYLNRHSTLAAIALAAAGSKATHIVLCNRMGAKLTWNYPIASRQITLSNVGLLDLPGPCELLQKGPPRVIGLLSNLTVEKGLVVFLRFLELAQEAGLPVIGILAGPLSTPAAVEVIETAKKKNVQVSYRGPVYGVEKERFFQDLDLFVFPTRYMNEAEPFVVLEALAHGVPVISTCRGCIPEMIDDGSGLALESDEPEDFLRIVSAWWVDPVRFEAVRETARQRRARMADEAFSEREKLVMFTRTLHSDRSK